jgi:Domain of unknown function (DUF222)/HNH endonuclease
MNELRSAIEKLRREDLTCLPDARAEEDFVELQRASELLEAERLRRLADLERRGIHQRDGHLSVASWLATNFKVGWGQAKAELRAARGLESMPETKKALDEGEVSLAAAKLLVAAREVDPEAFSRCEPELVEAARVHQVRDLQRVTSEWRQMAERERGMSGDEALRETRRLHASPTFGGMVRVDGDLDPETGETLLTALRAVMDAEARSGGEDFRSPAQRRADALGEVCRQWLDRTDRPQVGGERPHVTITVGLADLRELQGSAELDHTGPVPVEVARRIACDVSIVRAVMAGPSEPLDLGRRTPLVSAAQRRAVILRDRSCRFPGCDRPPVWCDAHHIVHWEDGGPTDLCNLILLCRRHHTLLHAWDGFTLAVEDGRPVFRRPDGSVLEDVSERAPPLAV